MGEVMGSGQGQGLPEVMKSTDNEAVIKLSKFISLCFEKSTKCLQVMNADSQQGV